MVFICKLVEKAYREQHRVYIRTATPEQTRQLDNLLWTFRAGSFIPHQIYSGVLPARENSVILGTLEAPDDWLQTLINLAPEIPEMPGEYKFIIEVLDNSEACKQAGRKRYRDYQRMGLKINTHTIGVHYAS